SYIRLGKFMGKVKVSYEKCNYEIVEKEEKCFGYINSVDLSEEVKIKSFELINIHPVPLFKNLKVKGELYKINTGDGVIYYPVNVKLGGN
ncbi:MAG: type I-D CRISPR-associated protein Cas5/Csc1, partial [Clostridium sp.]